ncbi:MAG: winged helix-turn-helix domain-containing protein [Acidobacteria bacterium]|nr:winged helix-turn-helix domain-containing protein [Acidobacteriota bacterium]
MNNFQTRYFEFGGFRLDTVERLLLCDGKRVSLTHKSYDLLLTLLENRGHLLTHDELMGLVWQDTAVDQSSLRQNIALIRKALGDGSEESEFIQTVPKYGYRFIAPVRLLPDEGIALVAERRSVMQVELEEELEPAATALQKVAVRPARRPFRRAAVAAVVLLFLIVPVWLFWRQKGAVVPKTPVFGFENIVPKKLTDVGGVELGALSSNGGFVVYTTLGGGESALWIKQIEGRDAVKLAAVPSPDRIGAFTITHDDNWVYYVLAKKGDWGRAATLFRVSVFGGKPQKITENLDGFVSFSPDDKRMVFDRFSEQGCRLVIANAADGGDERVLAESPSKPQFLDPQWSPDGAEILYFDIERRAEGNFFSVATISVADATIRPVIAASRQRIWFLSWTREGGIIMNAADPATKLAQLYAVSYPDGRISRLTNDLTYYTGLSVGGRSILSTKSEIIASLWLSDTNNLKAPPKKIAADQFFSNVVWTPDKRLLFDFSDAGKRHLWLMNADGGDRERISPNDWNDLMPDVSPDGRTIVFISNRGGTYELWTSDIDGSRPRQLTFGNLGVWAPRFAPDGRSVYYEIRDSGSTVKRIGLADNVIEDVVDDVWVDLYDLSPDGRYIAYSYTEKDSQEGRIVVRPREGGGQARVFKVEATRFLRFTRDGAGLVFKNSDLQKAPASAIWFQPLDGAPARELVDFKQEDVFWADYSPDKQQLLTVRGRYSSDLILLTSVEKPAE